MKRSVTKKLLAAVILTTWGIQPLYAADVSNWTDLTSSVAQGESQINITTIDGVITGTLSGNNNILSGNETNRLFNFANGSDVTLENLQLQNGQHATQGGAIYNKGSLNIINSTIANNKLSTASADGGGAIYINTGSTDIETKIIGSTFTNNESISNYYKPPYTGLYSDGGAITLKTGALSIENSTFENNKSDVGGAVYERTQGNNVYLSIKDSTFKNNTAGVAGAIVIMSKAKLENVKFIGNRAEATNNVGGGALFLGSESQLEITGGEFSDNYSSANGGAIATRPAVNPGLTLNNNSKATLSISGATFTGNVADGSGGAIDNYFYNDGNGGNVSITNSIFTGNSATNGGALANHSELDASNTNTAPTLITSGSIFSDNNATNGGAIYNVGEAIIGGGSTFTNNTAETGGGAIYNESKLSLDTTTGNIEFSNNLANNQINDILASNTSSIDIIDTSANAESHSVIIDAIAGGGSIEKTAASNLILNNDNSNFLGTYVQSAGKTEVNSSFFGGSSSVETGSELALNDGAKIVSGSNIEANGTVNIANDANVTVEGEISGNGTLKNEGKLTVQNTILSIKEIIQTGKDAILTIANGGKLQSTTASLESGTLEIQSGGEIEGNVAVTSAVKLEILGEKELSSNGLKVGNGYIVADAGSSMNLADDAKFSGALDYSLIITNADISASTPGTDFEIGDGGELILSDNATTNNGIVVDNNGKLQLAPTKGNELNILANNNISGSGTVVVDEIIIPNGQINPDFDANQPISATNPEMIDKHLGIGTIKISSDNSNFNGNFVQKMGNVIAQAGSKFFRGTNTIEGGTLTIENGVNVGTDIEVKTNANGGYATINIYNPITGTVANGNNTTISADEIGNGNNAVLTYMNETISGPQITINGGAGLGLFNNTLIAGDSTNDKLSLYNNSGVRDLTLGNGSGIIAKDIELGENTSLTFTDNVVHRNDSTITMNANSKLTFANNTTDYDYAALISSIDDTALITKTGNATTKIQSSLANYTGSLNILGGQVDLESSDDITLKNIVVKDSNLNLNSSVIATGNITINSASVDSKNGDLKANGSLDISNSTVSIAGNIESGNTSIINYAVVTVGNDLIYKDLNINNSTLNAIGNLSAENTTVTDANVSANDITLGDLNLTSSDIIANGSFSANELNSNNSKLRALKIKLGNTNIKNTEIISNGEFIVLDTKLDNSKLTANADIKTGNLRILNSVVSTNNTLTAEDTEVIGQNAMLSVIGDASFNSLILADSVFNAGANVNIANSLIFTQAGSNVPTLNLLNGSINTITTKDTFMESDVNITVDLDPVNGAMDSIVTNTFINNNKEFIVNNVNLVSTPRDNEFVIGTKGFVNSADGNTARFSEKSFLANTEMGRYLIKTGGANSAFVTGTLLKINPQMYRGQVATIASWQNQLVVNNMLFDHMQVISRQQMENSKTANLKAAAYPQFAPYQYSAKDGGLWYKAYGNLERLSMTKGLSVGNNAYGSLIGGDFPLVNLKNGWKLIPTAYIGYNGGHQHFNGVSMYQNGAQLGLMGTAYKGDFLTSLLAYGGGYANDMTVRGQYGNASDTTGNWFAGIASKSAYNFHLTKDLILQPTALISYNAFGSQNWGSNFGAMSMSTGMLNGINAAPGVNLIWSKKTFSVYATAQMVYNILGGVDGQAGNIDTGDLKMRHSYFEYGLGIMKQFKERFSGYLQITMRNGGRTGVGFQGGIQIRIGK